MLLMISHKVLNLASDVLKQVPELIDYESTYKLISDDMNPLNVVLLQEVQCIYYTILHQGILSGC